MVPVCSACTIQGIFEQRPPVKDPKFDRLNAHHVERFGGVGAEGVATVAAAGADVFLLKSTTSPAAFLITIAADFFAGRSKLFSTPEMLGVRAEVFARAAAGV